MKILLKVEDDEDIAQQLFLHNWQSNKYWADIGAGIEVKRRLLVYADRAFAFVRVDGVGHCFYLSTGHAGHGTKGTWIPCGGIDNTNKHGVTYGWIIKAHKKSIDSKEFVFHNKLDLPEWCTTLAGIVKRQIDDWNEGDLIEEVK